MENAKIPSHIGIIMDGNGRWATQKGKERSYGHKFGSQNVEKIAEHAFKRGVKTLSLYAFSTENWERPKEEVDKLMHLLSSYFKKSTKKAKKNKIRMRVMGDISALSSDLQEVINNCINETSEFTEHTLNIAINYGARQEIVKAVKGILEKGQEVNVENISSNLYTASYGEPDLIIRTGGELRLSNFMLFQGAYSELYFSNVLWPDFNGQHLDEAIEAFGERKRRFGKVN